MMPALRRFPVIRLLAGWRYGASYNLALAYRPLVNRNQFYLRIAQIRPGRQSGDCAALLLTPGGIKQFIKERRRSNCTAGANTALSRC